MISLPRARATRAQSSGRTSRAISPQALSRALNGAVAATASRGQPARLGRDGPVCGLLARSRHAYPMDPRRSWLRKPGGRRSPAALSVLADLASEVSSSNKRLGEVNTSPADGFWRPDFAGAPHGEQCHCLSLKSGRSASAPALARRPFFATDGPQTTLRST